MSSTAYTPRLARPTNLKDVPLDDGTSVKIRKLSAGEVETIRKTYSTESTTLAGLRFIACKVTVDEAGNRLWSDADLNAMVDEPFESIQTIAQAAMEFSGLVKADAKKPSGDSDPTAVD